MINKIWPILVGQNYKLLSCLLSIEFVNSHLKFRDAWFVMLDL